jgi:hypothetical protein
MERLICEQLKQEQAKTLTTPRMRYVFRCGESRPRSPFESAFGEEYGGFACLADLFRQIGYDERVHKLESLARLDFARFQ